jgi:predicted GIY-YIG superfamily endonuclease
LNFLCRFVEKMKCYMGITVNLASREWAHKHGPKARLSKSGKLQPIYIFADRNATRHAEQAAINMLKQRSIRPMFNQIASIAALANPADTALLADMLDLTTELADCITR